FRPAASSRALRPFPTRRSSDLGVTPVDLPRAAGRRRLGAVRAARRRIREMRDDVDLVLLHDPDLLLAVAGLRRRPVVVWDVHEEDRKSTRLNSSHVKISYAVFC